MFEKRLNEDYVNDLNERIDNTAIIGLRLRLFCLAPERYSDCVCFACFSFKSWNTGSVWNRGGSFPTVKTVRGCA